MSGPGRTRGCGPLAWTRSAWSGPRSGPAGAGPTASRTASPPRPAGEWLRAPPPSRNPRRSVPVGPARAGWAASLPGAGSGASVPLAPMGRAASPRAAGLWARVPPPSRNPRRNVVVPVRVGGAASPRVMRSGVTALPRSLYWNVPVRASRAASLPGARPGASVPLGPMGRAAGEWAKVPPLSRSRHRTMPVVPARVGREASLRGVRSGATVPPRSLHRTVPVGPARSGGPASPPGTRPAASAPPAPTGRVASRRPTGEWSMVAPPHRNSHRVWPVRPVRAKRTPSPPGAHPATPPPSASTGRTPMQPSPCAAPAPDRTASHWASTTATTGAASSCVSGSSPSPVGRTTLCGALSCCCPMTVISPTPRCGSTPVHGLPLPPRCRRSRTRGPARCCGPWPVTSFATVNSRPPTIWSSSRGTCRTRATRSSPRAFSASPAPRSPTST